jgi:GNAT superfamily N-acetyltransferase
MMKPIYSRYLNVIQYIQQNGLLSFTHKVKNRFFYKKKSIFLYIHLTNKNLSRPDNYNKISIKQAEYDDIDHIIKIWPHEFVGMFTNDQSLKQHLEYRLKIGIPCFVAIQNNDNKYLGAVWCKPWVHKIPVHKKIDGFLRDDMFEINNLFVTSNARGQGIARYLLKFANYMMFNEFEKKISLSRIYLDRKSSLITHQKVGFRILGMLTLGRFWGRKISVINTIS